MLNIKVMLLLRYLKHFSFWHQFRHVLCRNLKYCHWKKLCHASTVLQGTYWGSNKNELPVFTPNALKWSKSQHKRTWNWSCIGIKRLWALNNWTNLRQNNASVINDKTPIDDQLSQGKHALQNHPYSLMLYALRDLKNNQINKTIIKNEILIVFFRCVSCLVQLYWAINMSMYLKTLEEFLTKTRP